MKKIQLLLLCIANLNSFAQSPNWQWAKSVGGTYNNEAKSVTTDATGNVYVAGIFKNTSITFGSTTLTNTTTNKEDIFIVKYDATGNVIWAKNAGGTNSDHAQSIITDASGNIYVAGGFLSPTITFGSITLTNANNNGNNEDVFLTKYDASGNVLWAKCAGGTSWENMYSLTTDVFGNVYIAGAFFSPSVTFGSITLTNSDPGPNYSEDTFLVKYDSNGNALWAKTAGGIYDNDYISSITTDSNGNINMLGTFGSPTITFDTTTLTNDSTIGAMDIFLVKYDTNGNVLWAKSAGGNGVDRSISSITDPFGNVIITGYIYSSAIIFGSTTLTNPDNTGLTYDTFLVKYDPNGNILWAKSPSGTSGEAVSSITSDAWGNLCIVGTYKSTTITFDSTTLTNDTTNGSNDMFIVKYDTLGNLLWAKSEGGSKSDYAICVTTDSSDNIYLVGNFVSSSITFGNTTLTKVNSTGVIYDLFIAKLSLGKYVWPGDTDNNSVVNNNDLLQIGLFYGQSGFARGNISNLWQADSSANWNIAENNGADIKHADCNGDGTIDGNDTIAINLNFNLTHAITTFNNSNSERLTAPDIYFITAGSSYIAGDWVDVEIWLGNATMQVNNLYGVAFNINYNSSLVQPGTENITYPVSWIGTPGTNAIKMAKIDALANTAYGVVTRINHTNASGFGKIADFNFQIKTSLTSAAAMQFSISNYMADNATGISQVFNTINDSISINHVTTSMTEPNTFSKITISPNPFTSQTTISFDKKQENTTIKIMDVLGKEVQIINFTGRELTIEKGVMKDGVYFVQVIDLNKNMVNRKIIIQ